MSAMFQLNTIYIYFKAFLKKDLCIYLFLERERERESMGEGGGAAGEGEGEKQSPLSIVQGTGSHDPEVMT